MSQKITLSKVINVNGKETKEVVMDFSKLTGRDLSQAESQVRASGNATPMINFCSEYQAAIAAKILGVKTDDVLDLPAVDYVAITNSVLAFLSGQA